MGVAPGEALRQAAVKGKTGHLRSLVDPFGHRRASADRAWTIHAPGGAHAEGLLRASMFAASVLGSGIATGADADTTPAPPVIRHSWPYLALGIGSSPCGSSSNLHAAIGGERLVRGGFGFGGEIGATADTDLSSCGAALVSFNVLYHFSRPVAPGWSPFVTGGVSLLGAEGGGAGGNAAVGIVRFVNGRLGLRLEARGHWFPNENSFAEVRVGLSF